MNVFYSTFASIYRICKMLSILIPTYNYDCLELVEALHAQAQSLPCPFEILVADDASTEENKRNNRKINRLSNCKFIELKENIGIARIRNLLAKQAQFEFLLFLDADVIPCDHHFLAEYIKQAKRNQVVCGGLRFERKIPEANQTLRYIYGTSVEEKSVNQRNKSPYKQFTSINFLIDKGTFMNVRFNESFTQYGHEDTLFGKELKENGVSILHIENEIFHNVPDTNEVFIKKTHRGIENLKNNEELLESYVKLLDIYTKIKSIGLAPIVLLTFYITRRVLLKNLLSAHPNMKVFAFYKLGYLCSLKK